MIDLTTGYLGFHLRTPLVASSSPLCTSLDNLKRMEDAGASAVVLHSLFEEQLILESDALDRLLTESTDNFAEAQSYFPSLNSYNMGPDRYLEHIRLAKRSLGIPVIASLNGVSTGGWLRFAEQIEVAGADALELNIYFLPTSFEVEGASIEAGYCELVRVLKEQIRIPLAVKLAPYFSSMANMAYRLDRAGADALVLFNRFYQPDFDLEHLEVRPSLDLSTSEELRLRLHWVALLSSTLRADLAITGGVHTSEDAIKGILAGAHVLMMTSALLARGISYLREVESGMRAWMEEREYESLKQMRGSMNAVAVAEPGAFERANYLKVLSSYTLRR